MADNISNKYMENVENYESQSCKYFLFNEGNTFIVPSFYFREFIKKIMNSENKEKNC